MKRSQIIALIGVLGLAGPLAGFAADETRIVEPGTGDHEVREAIQLFQQVNPRLEKQFETAVGYAVFPAVTKGAIGIGAAHDRGQVFEQGKMIGTAELTQVSIGAQLGGEKYSEVIFFETPSALDAFKRGQMTMSAAAGAVAAADGVAANAKYDHGVRIYTCAKDGLMFDASVGGQKFRFYPIETAPPRNENVPPENQNTPPPSQ